MLDMKKVLINIGKALCYVLLFLFGQIAAAFVANIFFVVRLGMQSFAPYGTLPPFEELLGAAMEFTTQNATLLTGIGDLLALLAVWLFFALRKKRLLAETGCMPLRGARVWNVLLCALGFAIFVDTALAALPIPEMLMEEYALASQDLVAGNTFISMLCIVVIGPIVEEVFFRGLVYSRLRRALPAWVAMLAAALPFALIHGAVLWIAYAFCLGLALGFILEKGGSLYLCILFHICFNFCGTYLAGLFIVPSSAALTLCIGLCGLVLGLFMLRCIAADAKNPPKEGMLS